MKWFQHDSDASNDAKIKRLILRHGAEGYAVYFHCLELISGNITQNNITFELEHDAEIIADNLKIQGTTDESALDRVNKIMLTILDLKLFESANNKITCFKMAQRLDNTISRNPEINKIKKNVDTTKLLRSDNKAEEIRVDKIRTDKIKVDKIIKKSSANRTCTDIQKFKGGLQKKWCKSIDGRCHNDFKDCMIIFNQFKKKCEKAMADKGLDPKSNTFYGVFNNQLKDNISDPDSWILREFKNLRNEVRNERD
jgi:hypothetical protein